MQDRREWQRTDMKTILKIIGIIFGIASGLFAVTFIVYMFNLDMKLMAFAEPYLDKVYDLRKRERSI